MSTDNTSNGFPEHPESLSTMRLSQISALKWSAVDVERVYQDAPDHSTVSGTTKASTRRPARRGMAPGRPGTGRSATVDRPAALDRPTTDARAGTEREPASQTSVTEGAHAAPASGERRPARGNVMSPASLLRWTPWLLLTVAAGAGVALAGAPTLTAICVVVLACGATLLGWFTGESRRIALREEIEGRSGELKRALTELEISQAETVRRLSMAVEFRDEDTGAHIERIGRFSTLLRLMGALPNPMSQFISGAKSHNVTRRDHHGLAGSRVRHSASLLVTNVK